MMDSFENSRMLDGSEWQEQEQPQVEPEEGAKELDLAATSSYFKIALSDPRKVGEGSSAYISYAITTTSSLPEFICSEVVVRRRFQDFVALHGNLSDAHPASVMPPVCAILFHQYIYARLLENTGWNILPVIAFLKSLSNDACKPFNHTLNAFPAIL